MKILGIETSCDETAVAIYDSDHGLIADVIHSQINIHQRYGGVVPELASRDHICQLQPIAEHALKQAQLSLKEIDAIGYTKGPGLIGALLVGSVFAKSLAYSLNIPAIPVHHLEGHMLACQLESDYPDFPFLALLISGGHTYLIQAHALGQYEILGQTLDDAVGEAFDKTAKLIGLGYPGGAALARLAELGRPNQFHFTRPMIDRPGLDLSFSGLKTAAFNAWQQSDQSDQTKADIAYAFQKTIIETLVIKCKRAIDQTGLNQLIIAGGVGSNQLLRDQLQQLMKKVQGKVYYPRNRFCTDNAAMIAYTAYQNYLQNKMDNSLKVEVHPRWILNLS